MREDEEFFRQIAMREIVCPCGEDCLDAKGKWVVKPKETASKKTGNPMITKHNTLDGLNECMASYVIGLHKRWLNNDMVKIKLKTEFKNTDNVARWLSVFGTPTEVSTVMQQVVAKLKFYRFSQPTEITEAASSLFGRIWEEMFLLLQK